jgi:hypothetical protein
MAHPNTKFPRYCCPYCLKWSHENRMKGHLVYSHISNQPISGLLKIDTPEMWDRYYRLRHAIFGEDDAQSKL